MKRQQQRNRSIAERCRRRPATKNACHIFWNTKACGSVLLCLDSFCSSSTKSQIENEVHIFSRGNLKLNQNLSENILYQERRTPCFKHHFFSCLFQLTEKVQVTPLYDTCIHNSIILQPIGTRLFILNRGLHTVSHYMISLQHYSIYKDKSANIVKCRNTSRNISRIMSIFLN